MALTAGVDRSRAAWWGVGAVLAVATAFVLHSFVGTFVVGVFLYYAARPLYRRLRTYVRRPSVAAGGALLLLELPLLFVLAYALSTGLQDLGRLLARLNGGESQSALQPYLDLSTLLRRLETFLQTADPVALRRLIDTGLESVGFVGIGLVHLFTMYVLAFYLLRDDHRLSTWFRTSFADGAGVVDAFADSIDDDLHHVFFGTILNAVLTAIVGVVVYTLLVVALPTGRAIPYPALLGLIAGAASLIPVVGNKLVYGPVTGYLFVVAAIDPNVTAALPVAFLLVSYVVVDSVPDMLLHPYVSGPNLHRGLIMLAYVLGTLVFGWYGIFLGPIVLVVGVHFSRLVMPELLAGERIRPHAVDPSYIPEWPADDAESLLLSGDE
jgi:predicted PurR-regulated permease PerM